MSRCGGRGTNPGSGWQGRQLDVKPFQHSFDETLTQLIGLFWRSDKTVHDEQRESVRSERVALVSSTERAQR